MGGSGSGKSAFAERLACDLSTERTYVATMLAQGPEAHARIARHRKQRAHLGFTTIEWNDVLTRSTEVEAPFVHLKYKECKRCYPLHAPASGVMLLDDLGNLAARALFADGTTMADPRETLPRLICELNALFDVFEHVVVVGNEAGSDYVPSQEAGTRAWIWLQGALCCHLATQFSTVVEVVAGLPTYVKGRPVS